MTVSCAKIRVNDREHPRRVHVTLGEGVSICTLPRPSGDSPPFGLSLRSNSPMTAQSKSPQTGI
jgi:hypothetical protein